jgi:type III secretory pathway component EscU
VDHSKRLRLVGRTEASPAACHQTRAIEVLPRAELDEAATEVVVRLVAARRMLEDVQRGKVSPEVYIPPVLQLIERAKDWAERARSA